MHRFLARFPRMLEELGLEKRYQLIVTTNFDTALEQAFDDELEPYDLAVYMANGPDNGKFVHFPHDGAPVAIGQPEPLRAISDRRRLRARTNGDREDPRRGRREHR